MLKESEIDTALCELLDGTGGLVATYAVVLPFFCLHRFADSVQNEFPAATIDPQEFIRWSERIEQSSTAIKNEAIDFPNETEMPLQALAKLWSSVTTPAEQFWIGHISALCHDHSAQQHAGDDLRWSLLASYFSCISRNRQRLQSAFVESKAEIFHACDRLWESLKRAFDAREWKSFAFLEGYLPTSSARERSNISGLIDVADGLD